jgi:hypothetical protein
MAENHPKIKFKKRLTSWRNFIAGGTGGYPVLKR